MSTQKKNTMKRNKSISPLSIIYLLAIANSFVQILYYRHLVCFDTASYIHAWNNYRVGMMDMGRTPVYPSFIGFFKSIFAGNVYLDMVAVAQHVLFLVSIYIFYQLISDLVSRRISLWTTAFYALYPTMAIWSSTILTESLAMTGSVFFLYFLFRYIKNARVKDIFMANVLLSLLLFLRPSFIYLLPITLLVTSLLLATNKTSRFHKIMGVLLTLMTCTSLLVYMHKFKQNYGVFSTSAVSTTNGYWIARQEGMIHPELTSDPEFRAFISTSIAKYGVCMKERTYDEAGIAEMRFGLSAVQDVVSKANDSQTGTSIRGMLKRVAIASHFPVFVTKSASRVYCDYLGISLFVVYLFLFGYSLLLIVKIIRGKKLLLKSMTLAMIPISNLIVIILAAQDEWNRLFLPSIPIVCIMFSQLLNMFQIRFKGLLFSE